MAAVKEMRKFMLLQGFRLLLMGFMGILLGCGVTPYQTKSHCPPSFLGLCESPIDAYHDSVNGIDPRQFDPKWKKRRAEWEEKNKALIEARKRAELKKVGLSSEAPTYRAELFRELRDLIEAPETPVVIPPKIVRALVLGTPDGKMYVAPHYVFFMLDEPRWVLRKIPERLNPVSLPLSSFEPSAKATKEVGVDGDKNNGKAPAVSH